ACWDLDPAPGAEGCGPDAADEHGSPCCYGGGCGHDFGKGCTTMPFAIPGETQSAGPACDVSPGLPGVLATGPFEDAAVGKTHVALLEDDQVVVVSKATCKSHVAYTPPPDHILSVLALVDDTVYVTERYIGHTELLAMPVAGGAPRRIPLEAALPTTDY